MRSSNICGVPPVGDGTRGALGYGNTASFGSSAAEPVVAAGAVRLPGRAQKITAGLTHTCAILENNELYCWGGGTISEPNAEQGMSYAAHEETKRASSIGVGDIVNDLEFDGSQFSPRLISNTYM